MLTIATIQELAKRSVTQREKKVSDAKLNIFFKYKNFALNVLGVNLEKVETVLNKRKYLGLILLFTKTLCKRILVISTTVCWGEGRMSEMQNLRKVSKPDKVKVSIRAHKDLVLDSPIENSVLQSSKRNMSSSILINV